MPKRCRVFRAFAVATLIVILIGGLIFAHRLTAPDLKISAQATGTPTVTGPDRSTPRPAATYVGEGDWVFSALPACFDEQSRINGPAADLAGRMPPAADRLAAGSLVRQGECVVTVRAHDIVVRRGADRLRVPPEAALYRVNGRLTLVAHDGKRVEIRRYSSLATGVPAASR